MGSDTPSLNRKWLGVPGPICPCCAVAVPGKELMVPEQAALGQAVEVPQVHIPQAGQAVPLESQMAPGVELSEPRQASPGLAAKVQKVHRPEVSHLES